ncbi:MAG: aminoacyl-tRNA hydrolase [Dehalococcoidia bacterium]|nr:MAG: aminoacyl-tRNA hydrolase [Dehalococcoidia bacterium]
MKLIVGLGNPGNKYAKNRHNLGFMCISHFAREHGIALDKSQAMARLGSGQVDGEKVVLARPQTFMNDSGESVSRLLAKFRVEMDDLLVIHDDLDLPVGKIRLRKDGGSGGHKGINSITACLGKPDFYRLRVGIGRPTDSNEAGVIAYVLSDFTPEEAKIIDKAVAVASKTILAFITGGPEAAMNKYNREQDSE